MKKLIMVALTCVLAACQRTDTPEATKAQAEPAAQNVAQQKKLQLDLSTPDRSLKTYWTVNDDLRRGTRALVDENAQRHIDKLKELGFEPAKFMTGDVLLTADAEYKLRPRLISEYAREITDVKMETESRAVVFANIKNATPIPPNVAVSDDVLKRRNTPVKYKYLLEKDADGWKVSQVYTYDEFYAKYESEGNPWKPVFMKLSEETTVDTYVTPVEN